MALSALVPGVRGQRSVLGARRGDLTRWYESFIIPPEGAVSRHDAGDPGWCGPDSVSWRIYSDPSALIAVLAAMLMQASHPVIADAFQRFGSFSGNPRHRFWLTGGFYFGTSFGSHADADRWVKRARMGHRGLSGLSETGEAIPIAHPRVMAYSHLSVLLSALRAWDQFGETSDALSSEERDQFCLEQAWGASMLGIPNPPLTERELVKQIEEYSDAPRWSRSGAEAFTSVRRAPALSLLPRAIYAGLSDAAVTILPAEHLTLWGERMPRTGSELGRLFATLARRTINPLSVRTLAEQRIESPGVHAYCTRPAMRPFPLTGHNIQMGARLDAEHSVHADTGDALDRWWHSSLTNRQRILRSSEDSAVLLRHGLLATPSELNMRGASWAAYRALRRDGWAIASQRARIER